jgi:hypothetical protein
MGLSFAFVTVDVGYLRGDLVFHPGRDRVVS